MFLFGFRFGLRLGAFTTAILSLALSLGLTILRSSDGIIGLTKTTSRMGRLRLVANATLAFTEPIVLMSTPGFLAFPTERFVGASLAPSASKSMDLISSFVCVTT